MQPADCAREAFAQIYQGFWDLKLLPMRHPWRSDTEDYMLGVNLMLQQEENRPPGQEAAI